MSSQSHAHSGKREPHTHRERSSEKESDENTRSQAKGGGVAGKAGGACPPLHIRWCGTPIQQLCHAALADYHRSV